jgi:O-methyltransferase involved in polyketide biosynthesis
VAYLQPTLSLLGTVIPLQQLAQLQCCTTQAEALAAALQGAGHDTTRPTAWLMEGLIGYLTPDDSLAMFRCVLTDI